MAEELGTYNFVYTWKIRNFSMFNIKAGDMILSPVLKAESLDKTIWRLRLYPKGIGNREFPCFLYRGKEDEGPHVITVKGGIGIVDANDVFWKSEDPFRTRSLERGDNEGTNKLMRRSKIFEESDLFLPEDTLTIQCRLKAVSPDRSTVMKCTARTDILLEKSLFQWNIRKFDSYFTNQKLCVPVPSTTKLEVEFFLDSASDDGFAKFVLRKMGGKPVFMKCFVTLISEKDFSDDIKFIQGMLTSEVNSISLNLISKKKLFLERNLYERNGVITLQVEVAVADGNSESFVEELTHAPIPHSTTKKNKLSGLNEDLRSLYLDKKFSDIQLRVGGQTIQAHKIVLSARSPVFQAMFEQDMAENKTGVVDIVDMDSNTLNKLLLYLYTDTLEDLDFETLFQLYSAADKYLVTKLKEECAAVLKRKLSLENVFETLSFADLHSIEDLREKAKECINRNATKLLLSETWKDFVKVNPLLASEVMILVTNSIVRNRRFV